MDALQEFEEPEFKYVLTGAIKKNITGILDAILVLIIADLLGTFVIPYSFFVTDYSAGKMGIYYLSVFILYQSHEKSNYYSFSSGLFFVFMQNQTAGSENRSENRSKYIRNQNNHR